MNADQYTDDVKRAWLRQPAPAPAITLEQLKKASDKLHRAVYFRNLIEYAAAVVVIIAYSQKMLAIPKPLVQAGCVLIVIATLYVVVQIHVRMAARRPPADAFGGTFVDFHRAAMLQQIVGHETVFRWYVAPFIPGFSLFIVQGAVERAWDNAITLTALFALVAFSIFYLNRWSARRLRRKLAELDALAPATALERRSVA